eukprot:CAMPEP_0183333892 /NCGR_PEP_ID=MMETSP0164_2-20130417/2645_1 /TAXON_ID=221442 /ORGANISM="Coccolithus pelagicus ssp braarudi, Strain PLY182g" /LENGTH=154 /DNA_ID=CAMNT_0025502921 /DNA_START=38 /DNA_END=502 /DNA_ORIENTATION=-
MIAALFACSACVSAYTPAALVRSAPVVRAAAPTMSESVGRREVFSKVLGSAALLSALPALAEIDYAGVGYLGGSSTIDVNNANIRVYAKLQGMYPNAAAKLVKTAPYKNKEEMYAKAGFNSVETATVKKYESRFIFLEPKPEYQVDMLNNGLYR